MKASEHEIHRRDASVRNDAVTERMGTTSAAASRGAVFSAAVVDGPSAGDRISLDETTGRVYVGTSETCHLRLDDRAVSRRHLALQVHGGRLRVTDLGSTNGTHLDGTAILEAYAAPGAMLSAGTTRLLVSTSMAEDPHEPPMAASFGRLIGASPLMRRLYPLLERLAASDVPVLVEGEPGTGKELVAEVLHERGPRACGPFVVVDASTRGDADAGAALFGPDGAFERARGGTLLVDHVSELVPATQLRLLRAMHAEPASRRGPRIVATTRRNLDRDVETGTFREDLFFELVVGYLELPPLRSRGDDVALLARYFWKRIDPQGERPLPADVLRRYDAHGWPHNVRELLSVVARYAAVGDADHGVDVPLSHEAPRHAFRWVLDQDLPFPMAKDLLVSEFERAFVDKALAAHGGNVSRAAAASGLARRYFQRIRARLRR